tara:strand:- start:158 stop:559 length:402 start_codon:yes stop_codon:yes gene_type:complete
MDNFDAHKWFKKQYLAEDSLNDKAKRYFLQKVSRGEIDTLPENPKEEFLKQMMKDQMDHDEETLRGERGLEEIRYPQDDFTQSQLVPRMEGSVNKETYKRFVDSLDNLLDDWYMQGFEKSDILAFMKVIIPSN